MLGSGLPAGRQGIKAFSINQLRFNISIKNRKYQQNYYFYFMLPESSTYASLRSTGILTICSNQSIPKAKTKPPFQGGLFILPGSPACRQAGILTIGSNLQTTEIK